VKLVKLALISILFFALLITGISFFFPSHVRISKAVNIAAGRDSILAQVNDIRQWRNWYPGFDTLSLLELDTKEDILLSAKGAGLTMVIRAGSDTAVTAEFISPPKKPVQTGWRTINYAHTDSTTLQWYMDFHLRWYPWEKFSSLLLEKNYGPLMEKGLENLKAVVEK
jgi:hypothetical protein